MNESDQQLLAGVGIFILSLAKKGVQQILFAFLLYLCVLVRENNKAANLTLNLEGGEWREYCARLFISRSPLHNHGTVPKEQKSCWRRPSPSTSASRFSICHLVQLARGTELPVNYVNTVVAFWRNKASMTELKEILLHFSLHSVNRVPGLAPSTNKSLWVFELELNTKNTTIRFSKLREL